jgi:hypothetical protein
MRAPYRSGDGQRQPDGPACKQADIQIGMRPADHPGKPATARNGRHAATPTGGRSCSRCRAGPSPGWAMVCRTSNARQTRSGRRSRSRDRRNRIARWHGRPRGTAPLSGPVPMRATGTAGRNPTAQVGLGRFGRGRAPFHVDARRIEGVGHRLGGTPKRIARKSRNRR